MRKTIAPFVVVSLVGSAVAAAASPYDPTNVRPGAFVGARLKVPLGHMAKRPRAELAFAPTQSRISGSGQIRTQIGEGLAFGLSAKSRPTLTIAGTRADAALGLRPGGQSGVDPKLGISTVGWVAIGVGAVALVAGGIWVAHFIECESDPDDNCGSD